MKGLLGLIQLACVIGGVVAVFNGRWPLLIVGWVAAGGIGLVGSRMVKHATGISESGREVLANGTIASAIDLLRTGNYSAAMGLTRSAVQSFRMGGDKDFLPIVLTLHAVALAALRDIAGAHRALDDAVDTLQSLSPATRSAFASELAEMQQIHVLLRRELRNGVLDPRRMVEDFITLNEAM